MDNMPRIRPNQSEHKGAVTAFTAATLAAKIYLNQGNYQKVEELTDDIIAHGNFHLYPDYYQLWKIPGNYVTNLFSKASVQTSATAQAS